MASLPPLPGSGKLKSTLIDADNPFRLPGDDHVFRMREEEVCELLFAYMPHGLLLELYI